jgi:hypothetical protein
VPATYWVNAESFEMPKLASEGGVRFFFEMDASQILNSRLLVAEFTLYQASTRLVRNKLPGLTGELNWVDFRLHDPSP